MWAQPLPAADVFDVAEEELPLDADESRALQMLVRTGMVSAVEAAGAVARRDDGPSRAAVG